VTATAPGPVAVADRAALQRRVLWALTSGQIAGSAALGAAVTVGAFVVQDILDQETVWGGVATAAFTVGAAFMSQRLSRLMLRHGRRPGLAGGYALATIGGVVAALGAERGWLVLFLLGVFLFGSGQASNLLARYAATDLAAPDERSRAMSRVVFASTFGAVFGPLFVRPAEHVGQEWFGWYQYTGPWVLGAILFALALLNTVLRLRPDPLVVAGGVDTSGGARTPPASLGRTLALIRSRPQATLALGAMVVSQASISMHIAGMYAFSPLIGRFADRKGRVPAIATGAVLLVGSTLLAALSGDVELLLFPALWGLGLGWNFGLIGGSSLLTESVPAEQRVAVQGSADLMMSLCGGLAGFASGFIRRAVGYHLMSTLATVAAGALLVIAYTALLRSRKLAPTAV
jgi:MFS family permease